MHIVEFGDVNFRPATAMKYQHSSKCVAKIPARPKSRLIKVLRFDARLQPSEHIVDNGSIGPSRHRHCPIANIDSRSRRKLGLTVPRVDAYFAALWTTMGHFCCDKLGKDNNSYN